MVLQWKWRKQGTPWSSNNCQKQIYKTYKRYRTQKWKTHVYHIRWNTTNKHNQHIHANISRKHRNKRTKYMNNSKTHTTH
jgi:hypothetical protein